MLGTFVFDFGLGLVQLRAPVGCCFGSGDSISAARRISNLPFIVLSWLALGELGLRRQAHHLSQMLCLFAGGQSTPVLLTR